MPRIATILLTAIIAVQGALVWHFATMNSDAHAHTACPVSLVLQGTCPDGNNVIAAAEHHTNLFDRTTTTTLGAVLIIVLVAAIANIATRLSSRASEYARHVRDRRHHRLRHAVTRTLLLRHHLRWLSHARQANDPSHPFATA